MLDSGTGINDGNDARRTGIPCRPDICLTSSPDALQKLVRAERIAFVNVSSVARRSILLIRSTRNNAAHRGLWAGPGTL
jgi:hypothetical protein